MTTRITTEQVGVRTREVVSPQIQIYWNPEDDSGNVVFNLQDMLTEDDVYKGLVRHETLRNDPMKGEMVAQMRVQIADIMNSTIELEGQQYPGTLLMGLIKEYFNQAYTTRLEAQIAADKAAANAPTQKAQPEPEAPTTEE